MITRNALLTAAVLIFAIAGGMALVRALDSLWVGAIGIVIIILLFERRAYDRRTLGRPGPGWLLSGESRVDAESGRLIRIWIDPETGERREAESDAPAH